MTIQYPPRYPAPSLLRKTWHDGILVHGVHEGTLTVGADALTGASRRGYATYCSEVITEIPTTDPHTVTCLLCIRHAPRKVAYYTLHTVIEV
jgi:hypothetical protein